jgi:methylated-DNA-[protein]-cysteine S-methyltransferase
MYTFDSPLGRFTIVSDGKLITKLWLMSDEPVGGQADEVTRWAEREIISYFGGELRQFTFPILIPGSGFTALVYQQMKDILYGTTVSYKQLAHLAGNHKACRAVGMINHRNPLVLVLPCHRVIGSSGKMVGFAGGVWLKEALLALEQRKEYYKWLNDHEVIIYSFGVSGNVDSLVDQSKDELVSLISGQAQLWVEGQLYDLQKGDELLIKAHQLHRVNWTSWDCVWHCWYREEEV